MLSGLTVKDRGRGLICSKEPCCLLVDNCGSAGCMMGLWFWAWTVIGTTSYSKGFSAGGAIKQQGRDIQMIYDTAVQMLTKLSRLIYINLTRKALQKEYRGSFVILMTLTIVLDPRRAELIISEIGDFLVFQRKGDCFELTGKLQQVK